MAAIENEAILSRDTPSVGQTGAAIIGGNAVPPAENSDDVGRTDGQFGTGIKQTQIALQLNRVPAFRLENRALAPHLSEVAIERRL